jgi:hypothetical protein
MSDYTSDMPSRETEDLLARLDDLRSAAGASEAASNVQFEKAVDALDQMAGRTKPKTKGSDFEDAVWQALSAIPGVVVSREPQTSGSAFRPDFLVTLPHHKVLVEAKGPSEWLPALTKQITAALDPYGADKALVVVPDETSPSGDTDLAGSRLRLVQMDALADVIGNVLEA